MRQLFHLMAVSAAILTLLSCTSPRKIINETFPDVSESSHKGWFPLASESQASVIFLDDEDHAVVKTAAGLLAADVERITGKRTEVSTAERLSEIEATPAVVAGTVGHSRLIDEMAECGIIDISSIKGKWESYIVSTVKLPGNEAPVLVIAGSDRRGTAYGLITISEAIGVSPWYWWADVTPQTRKALYLEPGCFIQGEPSVQYRGIFINDERFGGWSRWAEQTFDKESGKVGPKTYQKVFELLLRLKGNLLWPAMHNGTQAFNGDPENARLADEYAIVMGSSHCEQMLRNNEDEWKNVGTYGDFNYITNRQTMIDYWEERVRTNGRYENIYTLGLRGIHDYPMEGARTTEERTALMQKALDDQRDIIRRNVNAPVEEVPQMLCTYEEVLDAYHHGLQVPEDVTLLWSDDKHGYTRNLCNPQEQNRKGGAGIYYHLSYHGDPASWIWLSPLSPAFISSELTKAYTFGARKIWVFNVGDIKPAEKELSFAMALAWNVERWKPEEAHKYIGQWASRIFGKKAGSEIDGIYSSYYRLMAAGKDSHVHFVNYTTGDIARRLAEYKAIEEKALSLADDIPESLKAAYFELVLYPVRGASLLNSYQLCARLSLSQADTDGKAALANARLAEEAFHELNDWTRIYNKELLGGKWDEFFNWQPYHWYRSEKMEAPVCTEEILERVSKAPEGRFISPSEAMSDKGTAIIADCECEMPIWMEALTPVRNFSKAAADNEFCNVNIGDLSFVASATPINNVWHSPYIGPMWSKVGTLCLKPGENILKVTDLKSDARIDRIYIGTYPPFPADPEAIIPAADFVESKDSREGKVTVVQQLGFSDGVLIQPFDTPSYEISDIEAAPYVEYTLDLKAGDNTIELRTLPTLHVYEGREARYAASIDGAEAEVFSIHTDDFSAEWRRNVLHGYSTRKIQANMPEDGKHTLRISFLDPGIVLQQIRVSN
jgi:hypothetical protein